MQLVALQSCLERRQFLHDLLEFLLFDVHVLHRIQKWNAPLGFVAVLYFLQNKKIVRKINKVIQVRNSILFSLSHARTYPNTFQHCRSISPLPEVLGHKDLDSGNLLNEIKADRHDGHLLNDLAIVLCRKQLIRRLALGGIL